MASLLTAAEEELCELFADSNELFGRIDADGGGTLDLGELKAALNMLRDGALDFRKERQVLRKLSASLWREAEAAQNVVTEQASASQQQPQRVLQS